MFYNGFTLLMQILAGASMYWVGNYFGHQRGENEMYHRYKRLTKEQREYFSRVSKSGK